MLSTLVHPRRTGRCGALLSLLAKRWATNLGGGSTQNGRDSPGQRLGVKLGNGATVLANQIIIRQRGFQYWPGSHVVFGRDHTLHARCDGTVEFRKDHCSKRTYVNVKPAVRNALPGPQEGGFRLKNVAHLLGHADPTADTQRPL